MSNNSNFSMYGVSSLSQQNMQASLQRLHAQIAANTGSAGVKPRAEMPDSMFASVPPSTIVPSGNITNQYNRRRNLTRAPPPTQRVKRVASFTALSPQPNRPTYSDLSAAQQPKMQTRSQTRASQNTAITTTTVATPIRAAPTPMQTDTVTPVLNRVLIPRPSKSKALDHGNNIKIGMADTIGLRSTMEDEIIAQKFVFVDGSSVYLWAVLDGHGGAEASEFVAKNWPKTLFGLLSVMRLYAHTAAPAARNNETTAQKIKHAVQVSIDRCHDALHRDLLQRGISLGVGTTLCAVIYFVPRTGPRFYYSINVGDSRALVINTDNTLNRALTVDHKPSRSDEYERIWRLGGFVTDSDGVARVQGNLAVSRSVGDFHLFPYVSHDAQIDGPFEATKTDGGSFLICCDGVTDALSNEQIAGAIDFASQVPVTGVGQTLEKQVAEHVRNAAFENGSSDNISVLFVKVA